MHKVKDHRRLAKFNIPLYHLFCSGIKSLNLLKNTHFQVSIQRVVVIIELLSLKILVGNQGIINICTVKKEQELFL
jgi:hypothetical protein